MATGYFVLREHVYNRLEHHMPTLITGGLGFISLNIAENLLKQGKHTILFGLQHDLPEDAKKVFAGLPGNYEVLQGDVLDKEAVDSLFQSYAIGNVFHMAVITPGLAREKQDSELITRVNLLGTLNVLQAARQHAKGRFVYPSSASVYGANAYGHDTLDEEKTIPIPNAFYAISKYAAERSTLRAKELWGTDVVVGRIGAAFGPWERDTGVRDTLSAPMLTSRLAAQGKEAVLPRPGPRDWVYSRDIARALVTLSEADALAHDVYNISGGVRWNVADWCEKLTKQYPAFSYRFSDDQDEVNVTFGSRDRSPLAIDRLKADVMTPQYGLDEAFEDYMHWIDVSSNFWMQ
jgi:nucleoside-diphosphate-sugar epimerase